MLLEKFQYFPTLLPSSNAFRSRLLTSFHCRAISVASPLQFINLRSPFYEYPPKLGITLEPIRAGILVPSLWGRATEQPSLTRSRSFRLLVFGRLGYGSQTHALRHWSQAPRSSVPRTHSTRLAKAPHPTRLRSGLPTVLKWLLSAPRAPAQIESTNLCFEPQRLRAISRHVKRDRRRGAYGDLEQIGVRRNERATSFRVNACH